MKPAEALQGSYLPALNSDTSYLTSVHTGKLYPNAIFSTLPPVQLLKGFSNTPVCAVTNRVQSVWVESTLYKEMGAHVGETVSMPRLLYIGHLCVLLLVTLMLKVGHCAQPPGAHSHFPSKLLPRFTAPLRVNVLASSDRSSQ